MAALGQKTLPPDTRNRKETAPHKPQHHRPLPQGQKTEAEAAHLRPHQAGTLLKHHIPIKTDHWDVKRPGFVEVDLVSHSGNSASGEFLYSLNLTDIHSAWVETRAVMGKGETGVLNALQQIS